MCNWPSTHKERFNQSLSQALNTIQQKRGCELKSASYWAKGHPPFLTQHTPIHEHTGTNLINQIHKYTVYVICPSSSQETFSSFNPKVQMKACLCNKENFIVELQLKQNNWHQMIIVLHYVLLSCLLSCTSTEHKLYLPIPLHFGNEITQVVTSASGACLKVVQFVATPQDTSLLAFCF